MKDLRLIVVFSMVALFGCQTPSQQGSIVGTWEFMEVAKVYDIAVIKKCFVTFASDGTVSSYLVNSKGENIPEPKYRYHCDGNLMWLGDDTNDTRRISMNGDEMTMTIERSINPETVGMTLRHRRTK